MGPVVAAELSFASTNTVSGKASSASSGVHRS